MPPKIVLLVGATILSSGFFTLGYWVGSRVKPSARPSTRIDGVANPPQNAAPAPRQNSDGTKAALIPSGAILLQVAALGRGGDALALAEALQQKGFPAFVLTPTEDQLYRVQIGPYADRQSAIRVKQALEREGFQALVKRKN